MPFTLHHYSYCFNNPVVLVDLNGAWVTMAEGKEAHKLLQTYLKTVVPSVDTEVSIPYASVNGNVGFADVVYAHDGIVEVYEIKPGSYAPFNSVRNIAGREQLGRYLNNINSVEKYENLMVVNGTSLNNYINVAPLFPSEIHEDKLIKYYTYPNDPGMIYWNYINKPNGEKNPVYATEPKKRLNTVEMQETVEEVVIGVGVGILVYEVIKWGVAALLAPPTGGSSLVVAGCTP